MITTTQVLIVRDAEKNILSAYGFYKDADAKLFKAKHIVPNLKEGEIVNVIPIKVFESFEESHAERTRDVRKEALRLLTEEQKRALNLLPIDYDDNRERKLF